MYPWAPLATVPQMPYACFFGTGSFAGLVFTKKARLVSGVPGILLSSPHQTRISGAH